MLIGYARVSTKEQDTTLQLDALQRAGVDLDNIVQEKRGGTSTRPQLMALLASIKKGDVVMVYKLDRFARSLVDLLGIISKIEIAGATFRSLTESIDSSSPAGRMMLAMLGAFAEFERGMIRERSMAGQQAAMDRGTHCGRPRGLDAETEADIVKLYESGWYTLDSLAMVFDAHPSTIKRAVYRVKKPGHSSLR